VPDYDIEAAKRRQRERNQQAHEMTVEQLSVELDKLQGLSQAQITEYAGNTEDMSDIIAEVQKATQNNLSQAQLIGNIKSLGASATNLAKKVLSFM